MPASDDQRGPDAKVAEARDALFELIANLAALADSRGERAVAVMLHAIVEAYE